MLNTNWSTATSIRQYGYLYVHRWSSVLTLRPLYPLTDRSWPGKLGWLTNSGIPAHASPYSVLCYNSPKISVVCKTGLYGNHMVNNQRQKHKSLANSLHWPKSADIMNTWSINLGLWMANCLLQSVTMISTEINCHLYSSSNNFLKLQMHSIGFGWEAYRFSWLLSA